MILSSNDALVTYTHSTRSCNGNYGNDLWNESRIDAQCEWFIHAMPCHVMPSNGCFSLYDGHFQFFSLLSLKTLFFLAQLLFWPNNNSSSLFSNWKKMWTNFDRHRYFWPWPFCAVVRFSISHQIARFICQIQIKIILNENRNHNGSMITDPEMVNCKLVNWFFFSVCESFSIVTGYSRFYNNWIRCEREHILHIFNIDDMSIL